MPIQENNFFFNIFQVLIALCGLLSVSCQYGGFEDDFDDGYRRFGNHGSDRYGDPFGRNGGSQQFTECPGNTKKGDFCKPIPVSRREDNRGDRTATEFAWKLFKASNTQPNYALSPLSPQILLSYLAWVSTGQTQQELTRATGFSSPKSIERLVTSLKNEVAYGGFKRDLEISTAFFISDSLK